VIDTISHLNSGRRFKVKKSSIAFMTCSVILTSLLLLVSCAPAAAPGEAPAAVKPEYEWRLATHMKPGQPHYDLGLSTMLPRVIEERTNGRIKITTYPEGALADTCICRA